MVLRFIAYLIWSRVISLVRMSCVCCTPQLTNELYVTLSSPKTFCNSVRIVRTTVRSPVILRSSTCLVMRATSSPRSCLKQSSGSTELGTSLQTFSVTIRSLIENARGASTNPVPGLSQWRTSVCGSNVSKPGIRRNREMFAAGR